MKRPLAADGRRPQTALRSALVILVTGYLRRAGIRRAICNLLWLHAAMSNRTMFTAGTTAEIWDAPFAPTRGFCPGLHPVSIDASRINPALQIHDSLLAFASLDHSVAAVVAATNAISTRLTTAINL